MDPSGSLGDRLRRPPRGPWLAEAPEEAAEQLESIRQSLTERLDSLRLLRKEAARLLAEQGREMPPPVRVALEALEEAFGKAAALLEAKQPF